MTEPTIPDAPGSIALVDISYLFKLNWHALEGNRTRNDAAIATLRNVEELAKGSDHVIICRDAARPYLREQIFKAYKADRPEMEPIEKAQRRHLYAELTRLGFNIAHAPGYEADDVIATLARIYGAWCSDVRIICPDKDAAQCVTANVIQWIPPTHGRDWERRDVDGVQKKFGVAPVEMAFYQALMGDNTDNVPGVEKIGKKTAAELAAKYKTPIALAQAVAEASKVGSTSVVMKSLASNWNDLVLSLKLTTMEVNVPLDADALLIKGQPQPEKPAEEQQDGVDAAALEEASRLYREKFPQAAKDAGLLEKEYERERRENGEHEPEVVVVAPPPAPKPAARPSSMVHTREQPGLITVPAYNMGKYGMTTKDLQPLDLEAAVNLAKWFHSGGLYDQYKDWAQVLAIIVRAKELGIGITAALGAHHIVKGKPVTHADLIRALAERDGACEYLMPIEIGPTKCTWRGKNRNHPTHLDYSYTIEEARDAGLLRSNGPGRDNNWLTRPQDMLMKTAASKLARILWPGPTMGLYCPEEFGLTMEQLDAEREAA